MKYKGKLRYTVLIFALMIAMIIPTSTAQAASKPKLNKTKATICVSKTVKLKVTNSSSKVTWKSSNKKIATVSKSGKVKGIKSGKVTITAKVGKKSVKCKVTVRKHSWYTVEETGHFAKVATYQKYILCGSCQEVFDNNEDYQAHRAIHDGLNSCSVGTRKVYETKWIVDTEEYKICKYCNKEKS
jgi:hypothetical protein